MNRILFTLFAAAALAACSRTEAGLSPDGDSARGGIRIDIADGISRAGEANKIYYITDIIPEWTMPDLETGFAVTAASHNRTTLPASDSSCTVYGSVGEFNALSFADNTKRYPFIPGDYSLRITVAGTDMYDYTDPATGESVAWSEAIYRSDLIPAAEEGVAKPCLEGRTTVTVVRREHAEADITVAVANAAVCFGFSDAFLNYFPKAELKLVTEGGFEADLSYDDSEGCEKVYYWINPAGFTVEGTVWGQSPSPGILEAPAYEFSQSARYGEIEGRNVYAYTFDISTVGNTEQGIKIKLNNEPAGVITITPKGSEEPDFELNPDSNPKEE